MDAAALKKKVLFLFLAALMAVFLALFVPAGTLDYWQGWAYMGVLFVPVSFVVLHFLGSDPAFLERRIKTKEKEARQALIQKVASLVFAISFIIPGLDRRFGWSSVPFGMVAAADALVLLSYAFVFLVFRENSYAGRTVEVEKGQKVISSGPYSIVRHPMYSGVLLLYLATPIALGSYAAFPMFLLIVPLLCFRLLNEEDVLRRDLPGYEEYCKKVRYRLVPFVW